VAAAAQIMGRVEKHVSQPIEANVADYDELFATSGGCTTISGAVKTR
jgi:hypothetical protein